MTVLSIFVVAGRAAACGFRVSLLAILSPALVLPARTRRARNGL
jgi:hypothetical protein